MKKSNTSYSILILYAKIGGGHESLAWGLSDRLQKALPDRVTIHLMDPMTSIYNSFYLFTTTFNPQLYNFFYLSSQKAIPQKIINAVTSLTHMGQLGRVIKKTKPDIIISTHYFFSKEAKSAVLKLGKDVPVVLYNPDPYAPPILWLEDVDLLLISNLTSLTELTKHNFAPEKIISVGMPVRKEFYRTYERKEVFRSIGLAPEKFTILFGGSGSGMDNLEKIAHVIDDLPYDIQAVFLCGRNTILEKALKIVFKKQKNIKVFGFLSSLDVAKLMHTADVFVGKAGPNAMCEAILSEIPMVATPPILGQEKGNRAFIEKESIGFLSKNSRQTVQILKRILDNPSLLKQPRKNLLRVKKHLENSENEGFPLFITWMKKHVHRW